MDALIGPAIEVAKCAGPPFVRQIGYFLHYKKNIEKLRTRVAELNNTRTEVQKRVDEAENNLESIKKSVLDWFDSVDKETTQDETMLRLLNEEATFEMINQQCCKGWCCCRARWNIGRDAQKKMPIIDNLLNQGRSFGNSVSDPPLPVGTRFIPTNEDFEDFESRKSLKNQIMAALKDDKTNLVGVYGMGGVGKTMLVNQIYKLVMAEDLFDAVAMTTVSEKVILKDIQNGIAKQLGLERLQSIDNIYTRAAMLRERLMKPNKKFLVILDDLWTTEIGLSDVGIPYGETCCKVVITTKSLDVCSSMRCHKIIEINILSEEESWHLFKKNVGEDVVMNSPDLETVGRDIAKECGKLPIALVTIGRSLINKPKLVWVDTALQLQHFDYSSIGEIDSKVFKSIKLSYDHLGNEILKKCFLVCCSFPEDHRISIDELMMHVMGVYEILKNMLSLKQARVRLHTMLDKLMASCLLLGIKRNDGGIIKVWMHDIVRYVALSIASEKGNVFFAEAGVGLKDWPANRRILSMCNTSRCLQMLLLGNEISTLPEQPEFPGLLSLSLEGNESLKKIPNEFFQGMKELVVLDLSRTGISSLPTSISCLVNLHTLKLDDCVFDQSIDISLIGECRKLEILSLQHCSLSRLPKEIGRLHNLRLLNLSNNPHLHSIPPDVISNLSCLEELYMMKSFHKWQNFDRTSGNASLEEVTSLPITTTGMNALHLDVINEDLMFFISMDHVSEKRSIVYNTDPRNTYHYHCFLTGSPPICHPIKVLLEVVDSLVLNRCTGLKNLGQLFTVVGFKNMKSLLVRHCNEMEYVISMPKEDIPARSALVALEELYLESLDKLKEIMSSAGFDIWKGANPFESLQNLKVMNVVKCNGLKSLFSVAMARSLPHLESLYINGCRGIETIISAEGMVQEMDQVFHLHHDTNTTTTSTTTNNTPATPPILPSLRKLIIEKCESLKHLFGLYSMRRLDHGSLPRLEILQLWDCKSLVDVINICSVEEDGEVVVVGRQLRELHLVSLPCLVTLGKGVIPCKGSFENLEKVKLLDCERLKHLIRGGGLSQLKSLHVDDCGSLEGIIVADDEGGLDLFDLLNLGVPRPKLKTTRMSIIPLESPHKLEWVIINGCDSMKCVLTMRLGQGCLTNLKSLRITSCKELEALFYVDDNEEYDQVVRHVKLSEVLPQLRLLEISGDLPKLSCFFQGPSPINVEWPTFEEMEESGLKVTPHEDILKRISYPYQTYVRHRHFRDFLKFHMPMSLDDLRYQMDPRIYSIQFEFVYPYPEEEKYFESLYSASMDGRRRRRIINRRLDMERESGTKNKEALLEMHER